MIARPKIWKTFLPAFAVIATIAVASAADPPNERSATKVVTLRSMRAALELAPYSTTDFYMGFIKGVADRGLENRTICIPSDLSMADLRRDVRAGMAAVKGDTLDISATVFVGAYLEVTYPCRVSLSRKKLPMV